MTNLNSYRYNGLVHKKSLSIVDAADKKGFTVAYKKAKKQVRIDWFVISKVLNRYSFQNKPRQNVVKRTFKSGPRRSLYKLKTLLEANKYRTDLTKVFTHFNL